MAKQTEGAAGATFEAAARGCDARQDLLPRHRITFQRGQVLSHPFPAFELVKGVAEARGGVWRHHQNRPGDTERAADLACPRLAGFRVERSIDQEKHESVGTEGSPSARSTESASVAASRGSKKRNVPVLT